MTDHREEEIAALAGDALPEDIRKHCEGCESCRALRESTVALAEKVSSPSADPRTAVAIAHRALAEARASNPAYWIAPVLSASASAAALILWFGLQPATQRQPETDHQPSTQSTTRPDDTSRLLPDSLQAVSETFFIGREGKQ